MLNNKAPVKKLIVDKASVKELTTEGDQEHASVKELTTEVVLDKISKLTQENYATRTELTYLEKEIKELEKSLGITATPEAILNKQKELEKAMRTALKNLEALENEMLEAAKDMPDDVKRQWFEEIISSQKFDK